MTASLQRLQPPLQTSKGLQALFLVRLEDADAREVALVDDAVHLHALVRVEQVADVLDDLRGDELARHEHRDTRRVRNDLVRADPAGKLAVGALAVVEDGTSSPPQ